jgi:hypothetical protein
MAPPTKINIDAKKVARKELQQLLAAVDAMTDDIQDKTAKAKFDKIADSMEKEINQLLKDEKSGYLKSRESAVERIYKEFNKQVDQIKALLKSEAEEEASGAKKKAEPSKPPAHPKEVKFVDLDKLKVPTASIKDDLAHLLVEMKKPGNWEFTGKGMGGDWTPSFSQHKTHTDSGAKGWKAYIDQPSMGTGSTWRLYFKVDSFNEDTKVLQVKMLVIRQDH